MGGGARLGIMMASSRLFIGPRGMKRILGSARPCNKLYPFRTASPTMATIFDGLVSQHQDRCLLLDAIQVFWELVSAVAQKVC